MIMLHDRHSTHSIITIQPTGPTPWDPAENVFVNLLGIVPNVSLQRKSASRPSHEQMPLDDDVIFAPKSMYWHAARSEVLLPSRIELKKYAVVVEK